jgi:RNA polymerase sigma factor (sigma-70 family)
LVGRVPLSVEFNDQVERAYSVLLEDAERLGPLAREHVVSVASRRDLDAEQTAELLRLLQHAEVLEGTASPGVREAVQAATGQHASWEFLAKPPSEMPGKLLEHPVLRAEQEVALGRRIQLGLKAKEALERGETSAELESLAVDGTAALWMMIRNNIRLVRDFAKRYLRTSGELELEDLIQDGVLGLNRAAERFDPERGYKFSTYATWWIKQFISRAIDDTGSTIRLPVHVRDALRRIIRYRTIFEMRNNRFPALSETAEGVVMDAGTVQAILDFAAPLIRLDAPLGDEDSGDTLITVLLPRGQSVEDEVIDRVMIRAIEQRLEELAVGYDRRFLRIMEGRFGLHGHDEMTLDALGKEFDVSRERIRQLEKKIRDIIAADPVMTSLRRDYREDINGAA